MTTATRLTVTQRLQLVRDIAETLKYAHSKRLYHRALGPQSILVQNVESGSFQLRLMNWQTASRNVGDSALARHRAPHHRHAARGGLRRRPGPGLPRALKPPVPTPPTAPAWMCSRSAASPYHVFSGQPPAESVLDLNEKLRVGQGLNLSDVMDGCGAHQQELVHVRHLPRGAGPLRHHSRLHR